LAALIGALFMLKAPPCQGHRISTRSGPPPAGVSIPSLTHGQMVVIRDNLPATPRSLRRPSATSRWRQPTVEEFVLRFEGPL